MPHTVLTVFLSSTARDLDAYREAVHRVLSANPFFMVVRMEDFGPQSDATVPLCCDKARSCDLFVGLIGMRRGWEPNGDNEQRSITEMEYDAATDTGRERFICIAPEDLPIPGNLHEPDGAYDRQQSFRKKLLGAHVAGLRNFASPDALAAEILNSLTARIISGDLIHHLRPDLTSGEAKDAAKPLADALEQLAEDDDADLLALARNPEGIDVKDLEARLKARAEAVQQDGNRKAAEYWRHIGALAFLHDTQAALAAYRRATELDLDDANGWNELGKLHLRTGDLDDALAAYERVLALGNRSDDLESVAKATGNLGSVYLTRGDLDRAEEMHKKSLAIEEALERKEGMASDYCNLGIVYLTRGDLDRAEEMYKKSLDINKAIGRKEGMASDYGNLGIVYATRGDLDRAEEMYTKALALDEALGRKEGMASHYGNLGNVYLIRGDLDRAEEMFVKALALFEALGHKEGVAVQYCNFGELEQARGNLPAACAHWNLSRDLFSELGALHKVEEVEGLMRDAACPDT